MQELHAWLRDHGFIVVVEEPLDFGTLLIIQPPLGKTMQLAFPEHLSGDELIDMVRHMWQDRLELLS